jgi:ribosomal protein S27E
MMFAGAIAAVVANAVNAVVPTQTPKDATPVQSPKDATVPTQTPKDATPVQSPRSSPWSVVDEPECRHEKVTHAGTNAYIKQTKCKDCGEVLVYRRRLRNQEIQALWREGGSRE